MIVKHMKQILYMLLIIITFFCINSFCKDTVLVVPDRYAWGEIAVWGDRPANTNWYNDTITFSCGGKITFYSLDSEILINDTHPGIRGLMWTGLVVIGNDSLAGYRYDIALTTGHPFNFPQEKHICTYNNPDTNWNTALTYPDSISPIDTFYDSPTTNAMFLYEEDVYCISMWPDVFEYHTNTYNYKPILYLLTGTNRKIKLQINRLKISNGEVDSIYLNWAVDSCGNGKFMQTSAITTQHNLNKTPLISIRKTSSEYLLKLENIQSGKERYSVTLYDMKGRKVFFKEIKNGYKIKIPDLKQGMFVICLSLNNSKVVKKIIISK